MILTGDYHTHTPYSHGKNTIEENAQRAKALGLKQIGIADHGFSHITYGISKKKGEQYRAECRSVAQKLGIEVLVGMEANILGVEGKTDLTEKDYDLFDIFLCGNHILVWYDKFSDFTAYGLGNIFSRNFCKKPSEKLLARNTKAYINVIKNNPVDILTHLNFKCPAKAVEVAKCAADYGTYIELNSKKIHLTDEELNDIAIKTEVRFVIDSDAHSSARVGDIKIVEEQLNRLHFPLDRIDNIDGRKPNFRFAEYKQSR